MSKINKVKRGKKVTVKGYLIPIGLSSKGRQKIKVYLNKEYATKKGEENSKEIISCVLTYSVPNL